jgi:hypothetical protein
MGDRTCLSTGVMGDKTCLSTTCSLAIGAHKAPLGHLRAYECLQRRPFGGYQPLQGMSEPTMRKHA